MKISIHDSLVPELGNLSRRNRGGGYDSRSMLSCILACTRIGQQRNRTELERYAMVVNDNQASDSEYPGA
jgi:hypothetical protein